MAPARQERKGTENMSLQKTKKAQAQEVKKPAGKVRVGLVTATIWDNETEKGVFYNVTFERRYRDEQGNWHSTHSFGTDDLLLLAKAADLAHTEIIKARSSEE
jgi:hypothetical protein